jgi:hypothetical protein
MTSTDKISCDLDFELDGKHFGNIELSFSDNKHAFDKIPVPVVSIKNGAGNHGDESASGFVPAANRLGIPFISTELSGGANVDVTATGIGMTGVRNVMQQMGMIASQTLPTTYLEPSIP